MKVQIAYHGLESTPAIDAVVRYKTNKLKKFYGGNFDVLWTCSTDKSGHHTHALVLGKGIEVNASDTSDNLYKSIDRVVGKIDRQIRKKKNVAKDHIHHPSGTIREQMINETLSFR